MSLLPVDSDCAAAVLPLECLTCGMLISVTSILNYGIGSAMAILGGLPSLVAVYTYASRRQGSIAKRLLLLIALSVCVLSTLKAYSGLRPALYQLSGIAPVIFNLGLVPLWLQLAFVA